MDMARIRAMQEQLPRVLSFPYELRLLLNRAWRPLVICSEQGEALLHRLEQQQLAGEDYQILATPGC